MAEQKYRLVVEVENVFKSTGLGQMTNEMSSSLRTVQQEMQRIANMPVGQARTAAIQQSAPQLRQQFTQVREQAEAHLIQRSLDPAANLGPEELKKAQIALSRTFNKMNRELQAALGKGAEQFFPFEEQHRIRGRVGRTKAPDEQPLMTPAEAAGAATGMQAYRAQVRELLAANQDYILNTWLVARAIKAQRAQVAALIALDGQYIKDKASEIQSNRQLKAAVEHARREVDGFAKMEAGLSTELAKTAAAANRARAGDQKYLEATTEARVAKLQLRIAEAEQVGRTREVSRLQGLLAVRLLELANETKRAAQGERGYADARRRQGAQRAIDSGLSREGAATVTDSLAARKAAATRKITVQGYELKAEPELAALQKEHVANRRLILNLEKRNLLATEHGRAAIVEGVRLAEEINALKRQAQDEIRNTPEAREFRAKRAVDLEKSASPELRTLEAELLTLQRQRKNQTREQLLKTVQGRAQLEAEGRIQAEINALKTQGAQAVRARVAAEKHAAQQEGLRGGRGPGAFDRLQGAFEGPGFGKMIGRRFMTTATFALSSMTLRSAAQGIGNMVQEAEKLQRTFALIEAQFKSIGQGDEFKGFRQDMLQIARDTGISGDQVAHVGFQIKGVYGEDTRRAVRETGAAIRAAMVTGLPQKEIVDSLTAASLAFTEMDAAGKKVPISIDAITDKAIGVEERFGVMAAESIKFFGDISSTAAATGLDLNELGAIVGVMQQKLGISGGALSEQFGRILGSVDQNAIQVLETFRRIPELRDQLGTVQKAVGQGRVGDVLFELARGWDELDPAMQTTIARQIAGDRQFTVFLATMRGLNVAIKENKVDIDDQGKAVARQKALNETFGVQFDRLKESVRQFGDAIVEAGLGDILADIAGGLRGVAEIGGQVIGFVGSFNQALGGIPGKLLVLAAAIKAFQVALRLAGSARMILTGGGGPAVPGAAKTFGSRLRGFGITPATVGIGLGLAAFQLRASNEEANAQYAVQIEEAVRLNDQKALKQIKEAIAERQKTLGVKASGVLNKIFEPFIQDLFGQDQALFGAPKGFDQLTAEEKFKRQVDPRLTALQRASAANRARLVGEVELTEATTKELDAIARIRADIDKIDTPQTVRVGGRLKTYSVEEQKANLEKRMRFRERKEELEKTIGRIEFDESGKPVLKGRTLITKAEAEDIRSFAEGIYSPEEWEKYINDLGLNAEERRLYEAELAKILSDADLNAAEVAAKRAKEAEDAADLADPGRKPLRTVAQATQLFRMGRLSVKNLLATQSDQLKTLKGAIDAAGGPGVSTNLDSAFVQLEGEIRTSYREIADIEISQIKQRGATQQGSIAQAKIQQEIAARNLRYARQYGTERDKIDAVTAQIEADRAVEDAMFALGQAKLDMLVAIQVAAGRDAKAAELTVRQIREQLAELKRLDPENLTEIQALETRLVSASDQAAATRVGETQELIDFQLEMGEITVGQAISQLTALLGSADVQSNEDRVREIRRAIKSLKDQTSKDLAFNIGELRIPTLYEVSRLGATAAAGTGYNDNRTVTVVMHNYNSTDYQGSIDQFVEVASQPSRYGTYASIYPQRN